VNAKLAQLADRSHGIMEVVNDLIASWSYDLSTRKPGVSYVTPEGHPVTDLDLACYISSLVSKRAVVNLPKYHGARGKSHTEGEVVVSSANRHGRTVELRSNQKVWSFGVCIDDANVMTADSVGKSRTFLMQGINGDWHDGWETIEIMPQGLDKEVFDALCGKDRKMRFDYFIHPMRWTSVFGENFRIAKFAADYRIPDELRWLKAEIKRLQEETKTPPKVWPKSTTDKKSERSAKAWAYESFIDGVALTSEYPALYKCEDGEEYDLEKGKADLKEALSRKKRLEAVQKSLRFHVRASEFSWWEHLTKNMNVYTDEVTDDKYQDRVLSREPIEWVAKGGQDVSKPSWAKSKTWKHGVKDPMKPTGTTLFASMEMEEGVSYRFRAMHKSEKVAA
jgi:hypothetical protein